MSDEPDIEVVSESDDDVRQIDQDYRPIRAFKEWSDGLGVGYVREDLWVARVEALSQTRVATTSEVLARAVDIALRAAALDTGAIEGLYDVTRGFTITVATEAAAWEQALAERGEDARAFFDAQLKAYELVLDNATKELPVTEAGIRQLHEILTAPQATYEVNTAVGVQRQPLPRGQYKMHANHVRLRGGGTHAYAPVDQTASEMHRFVEEISGAPFANAHPVLQAAYAHHALTAIHPFADGNGRVARALASIYFYRAAGVPLLIFADRKDQYFDSLADADVGNPQPLLDILFDAGLTAVDWVNENARTAAIVPPSETLRRLRDALSAKGSLTHQELDQAASSFMTRVIGIFEARAGELDLPGGVTAYVGRVSLSVDPMPEGFRRVVVGTNHDLRVGMESQEPAKASQQEHIALIVSRTEHEAEAVRIVWLNHDDQLAFSLRDIYPEPTAAAQQRIEALSERVLATITTDVLAQATDSLRMSGY